MSTVIRALYHLSVLLADLVNEFLDKNGPHLAAAVTYYSLVSLFPLTIAVITVASFFDPDPEAQHELALAFSTLIPVPQEAFQEFFGVVTRNRHVFSAVSVAGLVWSSTTVFSAIRKGVNTLWGIRRPRPFFQERLMDLALVAGAGILMMVPMVTTAVAGYLGQASATYLLRPLDPALVVVRVVSLLGPLLSLATFVSLYVFLPNTTSRFRDVWPVALLAALAFEGARAIFLWYAHTFPVYNVVYGPIGALIGFLTWIYFSAIILLFGALVASRYAAPMARWVEGRAHLILVARREHELATPKRKQQASEPTR